MPCIRPLYHRRISLDAPRGNWNSVPSNVFAYPPPSEPAEKNWGVILGSIKDSIGQQKWSNPEEKSFFEGAYVSLDAIKNAWRNATMHVENKYTADEAEHIFIAVRGFMRKLASRLDEKGEPKCPQPS